VLPTDERATATCAFMEDQRKSLSVIRHGVWHASGSPTLGAGLLRAFWAKAAQIDQIWVTGLSSNHSLVGPWQI